MELEVEEKCNKNICENEVKKCLSEFENVESLKTP